MKADQEILTRNFHKLLNLLSKLLAFSLRQPGPCGQITAWSSRAVIFARKLPQISTSGHLLVHPSRPFHPDAQQMRASLASPPLGANVPKVPKLLVVRREMCAGTGRRCYGYTPYSWTCHDTNSSYLQRRCDLAQLASPRVTPPEFYHLVSSFTSFLFLPS
jgi:hypothetical protein